MNRLGRAELVAALGGLLLAVGVFLPWYSTASPNASIDGAAGALSAWDVHPVLRWLLLAASTAPFILIWIVLREHELSWPSGAISLSWGFWLAFLGSVLMIVGGGMAAGQTERQRKPPGVL